MGNEYDQISNMPKGIAQETNIPNVIMEVHIASQKQSRRGYGGDHAGAMRRGLPPHDQAPADQQQHRTCSVQTGNQGREVGVLFRDQAAALVVRRLAIRKASPDITSENRSKVAIAEGRGKVASMPG